MMRSGDGHSTTATAAADRQYLRSHHAGGTGTGYPGSIRYAGVNARAARHSLCASSKFLPATATALWRIVDHPRQEVWPDAPHTLSISNRYFDATPLTLLRGIVSDQGLYTPEALRLLLQQRELSPLLLRLASGRASSDHQGELAPDGTRLKGLEQR